MFTSVDALSDDEGRSAAHLDRRPGQQKIHDVLALSDSDHEKPGRMKPVPKPAKDEHAQDRHGRSVHEIGTSVACVRDILAKPCDCGGLRERRERDGKRIRKDTSMTCFRPFASNDKLISAISAHRTAWVKMHKMDQDRQPA